MPTIHRKYDPAKISDKVEARYPLRLVRLCLMELWRILENPSVIFGGSGSPGSGGGPGADLATRVVVQWKANGPYRVDTAVDGSWTVNTACEVRNVYLWRGTAGRSGSTILDLNRNGVSMYTTQANRPTISYSDADKVVSCALPDTIALVPGDVVYPDTDQREAGIPSDWTLTLEAA